MRVFNIFLILMMMWHSVAVAVGQLQSTEPLLSLDSSFGSTSSNQFMVGNGTDPDSNNGTVNLTNAYIYLPEVSMSSLLSSYSFDSTIRSMPLTLFLNRLDRLRSLIHLGPKVGRLSPQSWTLVLQRQRQELKGIYSTLNWWEKQSVRSSYEEVMDELGSPVNPQTNLDPTMANDDQLDKNYNLPPNQFNLSISFDATPSSSSPTPSPDPDSYLSSMPSNQRLAVIHLRDAAALYFGYTLPGVINPQLEIPEKDRDAIRNHMRGAYYDWKAARKFASRSGVSNALQTFQDRLGLWMALTTIPLNLKVDPTGKLRKESIATLQRLVKKIYEGGLSRREHEWMKGWYDKIMQEPTHLPPGFVIMSTKVQ